jgi:hypothetical protein
MSITYFIMTINEQYLHRTIWYTSTCGRTPMGLLYELDSMVIEITLI